MNLQVPKPTILGITIVVDPEQDPGTCIIANADGQVVGKIINIGPSPSPEAREREACIKRLLASPAALATGYGRKDGLIFWIEDNIRAAMDPKEEPDGNL